MHNKKNKTGILALKVTGLCLLLAVCAIVALSVISMIHKNTDSTKADTSRQQIEKLEQLFQAMDYSAITGIIRTNNLYTGDFGKYWEIADVFYYQGIMKEYLTNLTKDQTGDEQVLTKYLEYMMNYGCIAIHMAERYATTGEDYGNRDVLGALATETRNIFYQDMKLSETELESLLSIKDGTEIESYAETAYARLYE